MPPPDRSHWPAALRNVPLERLSTGALMLLDQGGDLVQPPSITSSETQAAATTGVVLDLRVAPNLRLGNDPGGLPPNMRAQAEPHIARSQVDPDFLVAIFQEGRFTDGGAVDCGYSVTQDGGLSWTRALIPGLTTTSGGPYPRATDPVVGIDLSDRVFLCTEAATDAAFTQGVILVSQSLDRGATVDAPAVVFQPTVSGDFPDKPWMAVNTFDGTAHAGRVLVTWTEFGTTDASPILRSYSDDHGVSWSTAAAIHSSTTMAQGSQPVFLPSGQAAIVYWNFGESGFGGDDGAAAPDRKRSRWCYQATAARPSARRIGSRPFHGMGRPAFALVFSFPRRRAIEPRTVSMSFIRGSMSWDRPESFSQNPATRGRVGRLRLRSRIIREPASSTPPSRPRPAGST